MPSKALRQSLPYFIVISEQQERDKQLVRRLLTKNNFLIDGLTEILANIAAVKLLKPNNQQRNLLKRSANSLRKIANHKTSIQTRRRLILRQPGFRAILLILKLSLKFLKNFCS